MFEWIIGIICGFILGMFVFLSGGWYEESAKLRAECEQSLPRDISCVVIMTASPEES